MASAATLHRAQLLARLSRPFSRHGHVLCERPASHRIETDAGEFGGPEPRVDRETHVYLTWVLVLREAA